MGSGSSVFDTALRIPLYVEVRPLDAPAQLTCPHGQIPDATSPESCIPNLALGQFTLNVQIAANSRDCRKWGVEIGQCDFNLQVFIGQEKVDSAKLTQDSNLEEV